MGITGEAGELATALQRWLHYGKVLDVTNVKEELGDLLWYISLACNALGLDLGEVMAANIRKLKVRYPEKWSEDKAENRDTEAETKVLVSPQHSSMFEGKRCEKCPQPATRVSYDTDRTYTQNEAHFFCEVHNRPAMIVPGTGQIIPKK